MFWDAETETRYFRGTGSLLGTKETSNDADYQTRHIVIGSGITEIGAYSFSN